MQITIKGTDRCYLWKIKSKARNKIYFRINGQMYTVHTSELVRCRRSKYGEAVGTDDIIMFMEDSRVPYESKNPELYNQDHILEGIDARKFAYRKKPKWGIWGKVSGKNFEKWWPLLVLAIFGILIAAAFMG